MRSLMAANARSASNLLRLGEENAHLVGCTVIDQTLEMLAAEQEAQNPLQGGQALDRSSATLPQVASFEEFDATHNVIVEGVEVVSGIDTQLHELSVAFDGVLAASHTLIALHNALSHSVPGTDVSSDNCAAPTLDDTLVMPVQPGDTLVMPVQAEYPIQ